MITPTSGRAASVTRVIVARLDPTIEQSAESKIGVMRRAVLLILFALTPSLLAQTPTSTPKKIEVAYTQFTLPNGLHVILHEDHSVPIATVNTWYHVGSARERTGRTGFAHLFEHLMFMCSGHVKPGEFGDWLEAT